MTKIVKHSVIWPLIWKQVHKLHFLCHLSCMRRNSYVPTRDDRTVTCICYQKTYIYETNQQHFLLTARAYADMNSTNKHSHRTECHPVKFFSAFKNKFQYQIPVFLITNKSQYFSFVLQLSYMLIQHHIIITLCIHTYTLHVATTQTGNQFISILVSHIP